MGNGVLGDMERKKPVSFLALPTHPWILNSAMTLLNDYLSTQKKKKKMEYPNKKK